MNNFNKKLLWVILKLLRHIEFLLLFAFDIVCIFQSADTDRRIPKVHRY